MIPGAGGKAGMMKMMSVLREEDGIAKLLQQPVYPLEEGSDEPTASQADIVADLINIMRLDVWRMAQEQGVELEIKRMTPESAAFMLQGLVKGDNLELVEKFNEIEDYNELVLGEMLDDGELDEHRDMKIDHLFSESDYERPTPLDEQDVDDIADSLDDAEPVIEADEDEPRESESADGE